MLKLTLVSLLIIGTVYAAPVSEGESEKSQPEVAKKEQQPEISEHDASSAAIKIPVETANKLLYDLDAQVRQMFDESAVKEEKSDDEQSGSDDPSSYSAANRELDIYPRQSLDTKAQQQSLVAQLENLEKRLLSTINELQTRRRYFSSTMLRQMYNSVHRIRMNISRIQNQFSAPQPDTQMGTVTRPGQSGMMQQLQQRVTDIQKAVNDIINRVTSTFQAPTKAPGQVMQVNF